jgi:CheY-like chemotaxis protein
MPNIETQREHRILLVEDNPGDARLTREALRDNDVTCEIHHVFDGLEAMRFLRRQPPHELAPTPDLILLDLNLPRMNGEEVLAAIKAEPALAGIPAVILTSSTAEADVRHSYELHANGYVTKPVDLDGYISVVRSITDFWFHTMGPRNAL